MLKYVVIALLLLPSPSPKPRAGSSNGNQYNNAPQLAASPLNSPNVQAKDTGSQTGSSQTKEADSQTEIAKAAQVTNNRITNATVVIAVFGVLSFVATCFYIIAAFLQWSSIKKQAKKAEEQVTEMQIAARLTRKSMRYSQSAYVTVKDVTVLFENGKPLQFIIRFTNTGTTPAYNMRVYAHVTNEDKPFTFTHEQAKDLKGAEVSQSILGANGARSHTKLISQPLTLGMVNWARQKQPYHIWGITTYTDVFRRKRWTTFCYVSELRNPRADAATSGNEADGH